MKNILRKIKKHILLISIILLILFIIVTLLLNTVFSVTFRKFVYVIIGILFFVGLIIGIVQTTKNSKKTSTKIIMTAVITFVLTVTLIFAPLWLFIAAALVFHPEHIIEKDNQKYVAEVRSFLDVYVYYYDYINPFVQGNTIRIREYYGDGGYDPFDGEHNDYKPESTTYYDENGNPINSYENNENNENYENNESNENYEIYSNNTSIEINEESADDYVLYREEFGENTIIEIVSRGTWSGKDIIQIMKSNDNGQNWTSQLETSDETMDVHYNCKFVFLNENLGFINDINDPNAINKENTLVVTNDGGKTFKEVELADIENNQKVYCDEVPYLEDNELKLKVYTLDSSGMRYNYVFTSNDNGQTWKYIEN